MSQAKETKKSEKNFLWSDDETALLVQVIIDYKSTKSANGLDWETIKNKYEEITERLDTSSGCQCTQNRGQQQEYLFA